MGQGTGLGLDIVRRLVRHNDGEISVESQPGRTQFRVALRSPMTAGGRSAVTKPVLMVVDDDPPVLAAVRRDLRSRYREHYTIMGAASGAKLWPRVPN